MSGATRARLRQSAALVMLFFLLANGVPRADGENLAPGRSNGAGLGSPGAGPTATGAVSTLASVSDESPGADERNALPSRAGGGSASSTALAGADYPTVPVALAVVLLSTGVGLMIWGHRPGRH